MNSCPASKIIGKLGFWSVCVGCSNTLLIHFVQVLLGSGDLSQTYQFNQYETIYWILDNYADL